MDSLIAWLRAPLNCSAVARFPEDMTVRLTDAKSVEVRRQCHEAADRIEALQAEVNALRGEPTSPKR